ncbi:hypothetical protein PQQ88_30400 [Paraburkholderia caledonica]|uniref:hypothetical protein n=1 Tax=Paraburkholderia caledonica TaxID=134536 RepID=UPI0038BB3E99
MKARSRLIFLAVLAVVMSGSVAFSAESATSPEHEAHGHSDDAPVTKSAKSSQFDAQMRNMQAIHEKMMAAKTPQEHAALMDGQMKAMQDGMAMMDKMKQDSSGHTMSPRTHEMMEKRLDMMQMMMRSMMDRQAAENQSTVN